ncbi:glycosyltransferase family 2 protein [Acinetobacter sp. ANC 4173]|uniref:glycosyltransferase family 2 protein n=1 Tax=Acinetobacter sp. ANC 4173 TaxID=2529837 RepID=UPI00103A27A9|nr:glycosyltransferase family 2 protein [Acinetobacter sp. ANC 4173]TCB80456.1 glycosyltransferase family 2 protein [Acinetobacter sp. ANC 4173]
MSLVSIITPSYNSAKFIGKTIDSVISQTYKEWEMIIIDDCSIDSSVEAIKAYEAKDKRIKLIQLHENSGAAVARNTGIQLAQGRFIAFLDSDDCWLPEKLERQIEFMLINDYSFTYTSYFKVDEEGKVLGVMPIPNKINYSELLKTCVIGCLTVIYDTKKIGKQEFPLIRKRQDFALWLKILKKVSYAYGLQENLANYTIRSDSISANKFKAAQYNWHLYRYIEKLSLFASFYYFLHYAIRGIVRSKFPKITLFFKI